MIDQFITARVDALVDRIRHGSARERVLALVELRTWLEGFAAWRVGVCALARELGEDPSNVNRTLNALARDGLLFRESGVISLRPGPHLAELIRDDAPAKNYKPARQPAPRQDAPAPPSPRIAPSVVRAEAPPIIFDDELRAILGRQDLDPETLAELEAKDLAAITAPRPPRSPSHARPPAPLQAQEALQAPQKARPPLAPEPPRPPDLARRVAGVAHPPDGHEPQEIAPSAPKTSPARAAWMRFFGEPSRPEDRPWAGLAAMTQAQILTVILLLLEVRAREGRLRNLAVMSRDKGEAVARGEFVVREWTMHELGRADAGATLADILAARAEDDSSSTPLADDILAAMPPRPPPATPDEKRAALDQIRAMFADHLPPLDQDLAPKETHP